MSPRQNAMYWSEWAKLRDVLAAKGRKHHEIEVYRKELTRRALGVLKSSKDFTNADLDKVLARIKAEREPDNFAAQIALQESPEKRHAIALEACHKLAWEFYTKGEQNAFADPERCERYFNGIARKVLNKTLAECTAEDLNVVHGILLKQAERIRREHEARQAALTPEFFAADAKRWRDVAEADHARTLAKQAAKKNPDDENPF